MKKTHLLLTLFHDRKKFKLLKIFENIESLFVFITTTLPTSAKMRLKDLFYFIQREVPNVENNIPNFQYRIKLFLICYRYYSYINTLLVEVVIIYR